MGPLVSMNWHENVAMFGLNAARSSFIGIKPNRMSKNTTTTMKKKKKKQNKKEENGFRLPYASHSTYQKPPTNTADNDMVRHPLAFVACVSLTFTFPDTHFSSSSVRFGCVFCSSVFGFGWMRGFWMLSFTLQWIIVGRDTRIERDSKLAMQSFYTRRPTVHQLTHTHTHRCPYAQMSQESVAIAQLKCTEHQH